MEKAKRIAQHKKIRHQLNGTAERPRLCVFRSNTNIYAQLIDDTAGKTIYFANSLKLKGKLSEKATSIGQTIAKAALEKKITSVVFDRGGFVYTGAVANVANAVREAGITI